MDIAVTRFAAADHESVAQAHEIARAAARVDMPDRPPRSWHVFLCNLSDPYPGKDVEWAIARIDGQPAGYLELELPILDNTDNAGVDIFVDPAYRRRGVGRALHAYAVELARQRGRKRLTGTTVGGLPDGPARDGAGEAFAAAMGARAALAEVRRRLDVTTIDEAALDAALVQAQRHAEGYSLVRWRETAPEELIADVAYLDGRLLADAPMGDLAWEPEKMDAARARANEAAHAKRRRRSYHVGARHDATGRLVAWTLLQLNEGFDWHAYQQITIVDPDHRGHRLGTIVKIDNLRHARATEPGLRYIDTWNAAVNDHMISINELMGFRPVDAMVDWQQEL
jgi:GNAT superfamily N-acetyltransferase